MDIFERENFQLFFLQKVCKTENSLTHFKTSGATVARVSTHFLALMPLHSACIRVAASCRLIIISLHVLRVPQGKFFVAASHTLGSKLFEGFRSVSDVPLII